MSEKTTTKNKPVMRPDRVTFRDSIPSNSLYDAKYAEQLFRHLSKGLSFGCFDVGVSHTTLLNWLDKFDSFAMARERGEKKRLQLLEAAGIKMVIDGNATAWKFMMQDYGMTEKLEVFIGSEGEDEEIINVTPERKKRIERIRELGKKLKLK